MLVRVKRLKGVLVLVKKPAAKEMKSACFYTETMKTPGASTVCDPSETELCFTPSVNFTPWVEEIIPVD